MIGSPFVQYNDYINGGKDEEGNEGQEWDDGDLTDRKEENVNYTMIMMMVKMEKMIAILTKIKYSYCG